MREGLLELLGRLGPDDLRFEAFPGAWPLSRVFVHIADTEAFWLQHAVRGKPETNLVAAAGSAPAASAIAELLADVHRDTLALLAELSPDDLGRMINVEGERHTVEWAIWHVLEHEIHHRGEISLAFGLLGREGLDV